MAIYAALRRHSTRIHCFEITCPTIALYQFNCAAPWKDKLRALSYTWPDMPYGGIRFDSYAMEVDKWAGPK